MQGTSCIAYPVFCPHRTDSSIPSVTGLSHQEASDERALCILQAAKLSKSQQHFDATWKKYQQAIDVLPEEDKGKKLKPLQVRPCTSLWPHITDLAC